MIDEGSQLRHHLMAAGKVEKYSRRHWRERFQDVYEFSLSLPETTSDRIGGAGHRGWALRRVKNIVAGSNYELLICRSTRHARIRATCSEGEPSRCGRILHSIKSEPEPLCKIASKRGSDLHWRKGRSTWKVEKISAVHTACAATTTSIFNAGSPHRRSYHGQNAQDHSLMVASKSSCTKSEPEPLLRANLQLSPLDTFAWLGSLGFSYAHFMAGRYGEASAWCDKALNEQPDFPTALLAGEDRGGGSEGTPRLWAPYPRSQRPIFLRKRLRSSSVK